MNLNEKLRHYDDHNESIEVERPLLDLDKIENHVDNHNDDDLNDENNESLLIGLGKENPLVDLPVTDQTNKTNSILYDLNNTNVNRKPYEQNSFLFYGNIKVNTDDSNSSQQNKFFSIRKLWKFTGPGLLISVAYLDPGNLESDLQDGALAGYKLLWVLFYSTLIGFLIQLLSVRLGAATGYHLAEICHREYGPFMRYFLWIMIEFAIIASDVQQVIGSAVALNLLSNGAIAIWVGILITSCDVFIFLLLESTGIRVIEAIFASFITVMAGSFMYMYIRAAPDQIEVMKGIFIPTCHNCSSIDVKQLVGIVGSIIMPHNIYFHSSLVLSRSFERGSEVAINEANKYYAIELGLALFIAFLCNLFVTSVSAKSFYQTDRAANVTLFNAGTFIKNEYGLTMKIIWAIGLLSAGQCSTISGTYAGQFIMEGFTKINLPRWIRIILTRSISIVPCVAVTLLAYGSIDQLNFWCNIIQAIQLPFALFPILHFTSSKRIMGSFRNNFVLKMLCYLVSLGVLSINTYFLISLIIETRKLWAYIIGGILVVYLLFVILFFLGVNNIYRIKFLIRKIFLAHDPDELDELLHTNPVYKRPTERRLANMNAQNSSNTYSTLPSSSGTSSIKNRKNPLGYLINNIKKTNLDYISSSASFANDNSLAANNNNTTSIISSRNPVEILQASSNNNTEII